MKHDENTENGAHCAPRGYNWILVAFLVIAGFFLFSEHRAHLLGALPFLLLFACLMMHLFMHHGHGAQGGHDENIEFWKRDTIRHPHPFPELLWT